MKVKSTIIKTIENIIQFYVINKLVLVFNAPRRVVKNVPLRLTFNLTIRKLMYVNIQYGFIIHFVCVYNIL